MFYKCFSVRHLHYANDVKTFLKILATVYFISALHVRTLGAEIK